MGVPNKYLPPSSEQVAFESQSGLFRNKSRLFRDRWVFLTDDDGAILTDADGSPLIDGPIEPKVEILLQTVVEAGQNVTDGQLVEAVAIPWFEIIMALQTEPELAFKLSPRKWEEIVAGAYKQAGFDEVILTPRSADLGRDVIAVKKGLGTVRLSTKSKLISPAT